jgi:predicted metal-dependent hydrolase
MNMPTKVFEIENGVYEIKYGFGVMNKIRAMALEGLDKEAITLIAKKKELLKGKVKETEFSYDDMIEAGMNPLEFMKADYEKREKVLILILKKATIGETEFEINKDFIDYDLDEEVGNEIYTFIITKARETLSETQKKISSGKQKSS